MVELLLQVVVGVQSSKSCGAFVLFFSKRNWSSRTLIFSSTGSSSSSSSRSGLAVQSCAAFNLWFAEALHTSESWISGSRSRSKRSKSRSISKSLWCTDQKHRKKWSCSAPGGLSQYRPMAWHHMTRCLILPFSLSRSGRTRRTRGHSFDLFSVHLWCKRKQRELGKGNEKEIHWK